MRYRLLLAASLREPDMTPEEVQRDGDRVIREALALPGAGQQVALLLTWLTERIKDDSIEADGEVRRLLGLLGGQGEGET